MGQGTKPWEEVERDTDSLASSLGPLICEVCAPKLASLEWFRATWQRGGAATGRAVWTRPDGRSVDAIVKLPVGPVEHRWTTILGGVEEDEWYSPEAESLCTPRVLAAGEMLGGYDLAWLVLERLDGRPLSTGWDKRSLLDLIDAAAMMQARAQRAMPVTGSPRPTDLAALLDKARHAVHIQDIEQDQRWNDSLKRIQKGLDRLVREWEDRPMESWCHGDVHAGNAMRRGDGDDGPCVLIDLALVHPGHWIEDAVYLERQFWGKPELLFGLDVVEAMSKARRRHGLEPGPDHKRVADLRRLLAAACAPAFLPLEGHPAYLHACLEVMGRLSRPLGV